MIENILKDYATRKKELMETAEKLFPFIRSYVSSENVKLLTVSDHSIKVYLELNDGRHAFIDPLKTTSGVELITHINHQLSFRSNVDDEGDNDDEDTEES